KDGDATGAFVIASHLDDLILQAGDDDANPRSFTLRAGKNIVGLSMSIAGDIGIGTIHQEGYKLNVNGSFKSNGSVTFSDYGVDGGMLFTDSAGLVVQTGASELVWDNVNKRLGIGTDSPEAHLDVDGDVIISGT